MTDVMNGLLNEAKNNKFSSIRPTLSDDDVISVWDSVSSFIEKHMSNQKAVNIPGLGTFTFSQKKLDVGNSKFILIQRPIFLLAEKFAQTHQLHCTKHHVTGQIPVIKLNFAALSCESPFDRDTVESCVKEVLGALSRSVASKRNVEFTFQGIGRLQIRDSRVKMKFYKDFLNQMDGSGQLVNALKDRPGTGDSVMSERTPTRCASSNTLILPRITNGGLAVEGDSKAPPMPRIEEKDEGAGGEAGCNGLDEPAMESVPEPNGAGDGDRPPAEGEAMRDVLEAVNDTPRRMEEEKKCPSMPASRTSSRMAAPVAKACGISFQDDLMPQMTSRVRTNSVMSARSGPTPMMLKRSLSPLPNKEHTQAAEPRVRWASKLVHAKSCTPFLGDSQGSIPDHKLAPVGSVGFAQSRDTTQYPRRADDLESSHLHEHEPVSLDSIDCAHMGDTARFGHLTDPIDTNYYNDREPVTLDSIDCDLLDDKTKRCQLDDALESSHFSWYDRFDQAVDSKHLDDNVQGSQLGYKKSSHIGKCDATMFKNLSQNDLMGFENVSHRPKTGKTVSQNPAIGNPGISATRSCDVLDSSLLCDGVYSVCDSTRDPIYGSMYYSKCDPMHEFVFSQNPYNIAVETAPAVVKQSSLMPESLESNHTKEACNLPRPLSLQPKSVYKTSFTPEPPEFPHRLVSNSPDIHVKTSVLLKPKPPTLNRRTKLHSSGLFSAGTAALEPIERPDFPRARSVDLSSLKKPEPLYQMPSPPPGPKPGQAQHEESRKLDSACGHQNAGQELCYLCHQRDARNIPVSFTEEKKAREREEERLLQQYRHMKDTEAILSHHENMLAKRHESQKMAAFNLGVADAVNSKKRSRDKSYHSSYIFQRRPLTPPRYLKQQKYHVDLKEQVTTKCDNEKKLKADTEFLERLEQVQLAEDLAMQRDQYLQERNEQTEQYKRALSAQKKLRESLRTPPDRPAPRSPLSAQVEELCSFHKAASGHELPSLPRPYSASFPPQTVENQAHGGVKFKPLPLPARVPDSSSPVFGKNDMDAEKMAERRRIAHNLYKEQIATVENRKRDAILRQLADQKEAEAMLARTRQELKDDRADRYERMFKHRKRLESDWASATVYKKEREDEERGRMMSPGALMHEQCDKYKRCGQCKRTLKNCGESNIWRESRYIPGSRLMV